MRRVETPQDFGLLRGGVRGVALLPQELGRTQEQPSAHFPTHDVRPLVHEHRQVAVTLHPLGVHRVDDRLRRGADHIRLLELLAAGLSDHRELGREAFHMLLLALDEAHGDQKRKAGILVPSLLEHCIQGVLHGLPDSVAPRPNDHASAHRRVVSERGSQHDFAVPLGEVLLLGRQLLIVGHIRFRVSFTSSNELRARPFAYA